MVLKAAWTSALKNCPPWAPRRLRRPPRRRLGVRAPPLDALPALKPWMVAWALGVLSVSSDNLNPKPNTVINLVLCMLQLIDRPKTG
jgi:hypothetical protein